MKRGPQPKRTASDLEFVIPAGVDTALTFVLPPSLRARLNIDRHHHSDIDREGVNQPLHVSFCLL